MTSGWGTSCSSSRTWREADAFYGDVLGFTLSDRVDEEFMKVRFYHCNGRHHSLAVAQVPGKVGLNHLMLEVKSLDDVGTGLDLAKDTGVPVLRGLGPPHQRPDDLLLHAHAVVLPDRVRPRRHRRRRPDLGRRRPTTGPPSGATSSPRRVEPRHPASCTTSRR